MVYINNICLINTNTPVHTFQDKEKVLESTNKYKRRKMFDCLTDLNSSKIFTLCFIGQLDVGQRILQNAQDSFHKTWHVRQVGIYRVGFPPHWCSWSTDASRVSRYHRDTSERTNINYCTVLDLRFTREEPS